MIGAPRADELSAADPGRVRQAGAVLLGGELRTDHVAAHGSTAARPTVLVHVELDDGSVGWGECPALPRPTYTAEYAAAAFALLRDVVLPDLVAARPPSVAGHPMARGAVADALLDAVLRAEKRSLVEALGVTRTAVPVRAIVSTQPGDIDGLLAAAALRVDEGYQSLGVKVGRDWLHEPVAAIRRTWPTIGLSIDANGSLGALSDDRWMALEPFDLDEIEQPCRPDDWVGSARIAGCAPCPISLDESISGWHDVRTAAVLGSGSVVNIKPARCGGIAEALRAVRAATEHGLGVFVGGMLESGVGRAGALSLAGLDGCDRPTHLGPSAAYYERDVTEPIVLAGPGRVALPEGEGIGRVPDPALLAARALDRVGVGPD